MIILFENDDQEHDYLDYFDTVDHWIAGIHYKHVKMHVYQPKKTSRGRFRGFASDAVWRKLT